MAIQGPARVDLAPATRVNPPQKDPGPSSAYQAILDAAKKNLGIALANADKAENDAKLRLQQFLNNSLIGRKRDQKRTRENDSARGLLHSSIALDNQVDVGKAYDLMNAQYQDSFQDALQQIAQQRLGANSAYTQALAEYERMKASQLTPEFLSALGLAQPQTATPSVTPIKPSSPTPKTAIAKPKPPKKITEKKKATSSAIKNAQLAAISNSIPGFAGA